MWARRSASPECRAAASARWPRSARHAAGASSRYAGRVPSRARSASAEPRLCVRCSTESTPATKKRSQRLPEPGLSLAFRTRALGELEPAPLLELGDAALRDERVLRDPEDLGTEPLVRAEPRIEEQPVLAPPLGVALDRGQRIQVLEARPHRCDELPAALAPETAHVLEHHPRETAALIIGVDEDRQRAPPVGPGRFEPRAD